MIYRKLTAITGLCLMMLISRSVQQGQWLQTGYKYPVGEKGDNREKDLKCAFWFSAKLHIQLTKILLKEVGLTRNMMLIISEYVPSTSTQLAALYILEKDRIGALWLVHLYVSMVCQYIDSIGYNLPNTDKHHVVLEIIFKINDYMSKQLESDTTKHCGKYNYFDCDPKKYPYVLSSVHYIGCSVKANIDAMENLLAYNVNNQYMYLRNTFDFNVDKSLIGVWKFVLDEILVPSNWSIDWTKTRQLLLDAWNKTYDLDWTSNQFQPIKDYYRLVIDIFKVITMRLTWRHLTYVRHAIDFQIKKSYSNKWLVYLKALAEILCLENDIRIEYLIKTFEDRHIIYNKFIDDLIAYIQTELIAFSEHLGCDATVEFEPPFDGFNPNDPSEVDVAVSKSSLKTMGAIIIYINGHVPNKFMNVVFALLTYLDELNK